MFGWYPGGGIHEFFQLNLDGSPDYDGYMVYILYHMLVQHQADSKKITVSQQLLHAFQYLVFCIYHLAILFNIGEVVDSIK
jgi:hypothetical protein